MVPWYVTDEENYNNADQNGGEVQLPTDSPVGGFLVSVSRKKNQHYKVCCTSIKVKRLQQLQEYI